MEKGKKISKNVEYANEICKSIQNLLKDENEQMYCHIDIKDLHIEDNLTEFFIAYLKAGTLIFNEFTGNEKNNLEFTHILNQLCVQDLLYGDKEDEKL